MIFLVIDSGSAKYALFCHQTEYPKRVQNWIETLRLLVNQNKDKYCFLIFILLYNFQFMLF